MSNVSQTLPFISGAIMMTSHIAGLLFARVYRDHRDRFFLWFSLAFVLMAVERLTLLILNRDGSETFPGVFLIRCVAFLIIIGAVVDKNRMRR